MHHPQTTLFGKTGAVSATGQFELLRVCAWCKRVHLNDGTWSEMAKVPTEQRTLPPTHGICPTCMRSVLTLEQKVVASRSGFQHWSMPLKRASGE